MVLGTKPDQLCANQVSEHCSVSGPDIKFFLFPLTFIAPSFLETWTRSSFLPVKTCSRHTHIPTTTEIWQFQRQVKWNTCMLCSPHLTVGVEGLMVTEGSGSVDRARPHLHKYCRVWWGVGNKGQARRLLQSPGNQNLGWAWVWLGTSRAEGPSHLGTFLHQEPRQLDWLKGFHFLQGWAVERQV